MSMTGYNLGVADDVQAICQHDLFDKYNLNYFQYLRCYRDGSFFVLCNHAEWIQASFNYATDQGLRLIHSTNDEDTIKDHRFLFIWENHIQRDLLNFAKENSNICNGVSFVERHKSFYDMVAFAAPASNVNALERFMNNQQELGNFLIKFRNENKSLFAEAKKNKYNLSEELQDINKELLLAQSDNCHLTKRELEILLLMKQGFSRKGICKALDLSPRTLETHLNRLKDRFDIAHASLLVNIL